MYDEHLINQTDYSSVVRKLDFALKLFKRAVNGVYPAPAMFISDLRRTIIDYEGSPSERNCKLDTDHISLYTDHYRNNSSTDTTVWLGVCDDIYFNEDSFQTDVCNFYSNCLPGYENLIFINPINTATPENTKKFISTLYHYLCNIIGVFKELHQYIPWTSLIHIITNFMYKEYNIDLTTPENFKAAFIDTNIMTENHIDEFFEKDFKFVDPLHVDFPSISKLSGTFNRWCKLRMTYLLEECKETTNGKPEEEN